MGRVAVRTATLSLDVVNRIKTLFGSVNNAYRRLGLTASELPYHNFYRAIQFDTITPEHKDLIMERWDRWQEIYLQPGIPESDELSLNPFVLDELPDWHRDSEAFDPKRN